MATLVLGAVGAYAGSTVGMPSLGFAIGSTIGGMIDNALHPVRESQGQVRDLKITGVSYGTAIPMVFGTVRLPGTIIWSGGIKQHTTTHHQGGKGGPVVAVTDYTYTSSLAVMLCQGPILRINRVWADADLIYDYNGGSPLYGNGLTASSISLYAGDNLQLPNSLVQASVGVSNTPAYRGRAYLVLQDYLLTRSGNRLPNVTAEVIQASGPTLDTVVAALIEQGGLQAGDLNLSAISGITVTGMVVSQRASIRSYIEQLEAAYLFDLVEIDGSITAVLRSSPTIYALADTDGLGAHEPGQESHRAEITRMQDLDLPRTVDVNYMSAAFNYQTVVQRAMRLTGSSQNSTSLSLPLVLSDQQGRNIAETALYEGWIGRTSYVIRLPWRHLYFTAGDGVSLSNFFGGTRTLRVAIVKDGTPGIVELTCVEWDADTYSQNVPSAGVTYTSSVVQNSGSTMVLADLPALRDQDAQNAGYYAGICGDGVNPWNGASLYRDRMSGSGFQKVTDWGQQSTLGVTTTILGGWTGADTWDNINTVTVNLFYGSLSSATQAQILDGANAVLIGSEVVQFTTAAQIDATHYTLSGLLRGRKGTEDKTAGHGVNDAVLLLDGTVRRFEGNDADISRDMNYKSVPANVDINTVTAVPFTITGENLKPWTVCQVTGSRSSGDLTVTWTRRTRYAGEWTDGADAPLNEVSESYYVDIYNGVSVVRTLTASAAAVLYTAAMQTADFGAPQSAVTLEIYQISARIGRGKGLKTTV